MDNQKIQELQNLANMVAVRNHLSSLLNSGKSLARKDFQPVGHLITKIDAMLVQSSLALFKDEATELVDDGLNIAEKIRQAKVDLAKRESMPSSNAESVGAENLVEKLGALWTDQAPEKKVKSSPNRKKGDATKAK